MVPVGLALKLGISRAGDNAIFRQLTAGSLVALISLLVYQMRGSWQIDMHMYYFANFAMLAFFCDPFVILSAAALTAVHHLLLNFTFSYAIFPEASFYRVLLHAAIVIIENPLQNFRFERDFFPFE
jgi:methyl-accepting chemotaxis protein